MLNLNGKEIDLEDIEVEIKDNKIIILGYDSDLSHKTEEHIHLKIKFEVKNNKLVQNGKTKYYVKETEYKKKVKLIEYKMVKN